MVFVQPDCLMPAEWLAREPLNPSEQLFAIGVGGFEVAMDVLVTECANAGEISLARFRDLLGVGRRDAQLLLERFDADGLTLRRGDARVLRKTP